MIRCTSRGCLPNVASPLTMRLVAKRVPVSTSVTEPSASMKANELMKSPAVGDPIDARTESDDTHGLIIAVQDGQEAQVSKQSHTIVTTSPRPSATNRPPEGLR